MPVALDNRRRLRLFSPLAWRTGNRLMLDGRICELAEGGKAQRDSGVRPCSLHAPILSRTPRSLGFQLEQNGSPHELRGVIEAELVSNVLPMGIDRMRTEVKFVRDARRALSIANELEYLQFPIA